MLHEHRDLRLLPEVVVVGSALELLELQHGGQPAEEGGLIALLKHPDGRLEELL